jgi:hypothetical protein
VTELPDEALVPWQFSSEHKMEIARGTIENLRGAYRLQDLRLDAISRTPIDAIPMPEEAFPHLLVLQGIVLADDCLDQTLALGVVEDFPHQRSCLAEVVVIYA